MHTYSRAHLDDGALKHNLKTSAGTERAATADFLADIAEFDARKLYLPAGYDSMYAYCLGELKLSEESACKRIRVARVARDFPVVFDMLADGRQHLSGLVVLASYLRPENGGELLAAAANRSRAQIEMLLAERFPKPDVPTRLEAIGSPSAPSPGTVENLPSPGTVDTPEVRPKMSPLSAERFLFQTTIDRETHEMLLYARALLGHAIPSGDLAQVLHWALHEAIVRLEKQKFGRTSSPRGQRGSADPRHIPVAVKRAVWERDGGRCSFTSEDGHRCGSTVRVEFDHVDPVACGGEGTVEDIRLRCRAHNQHEAEQVFGAGFMEAKRAAARQARAETKERAAAEKCAAANAREQAKAEERERAKAEACERAAIERDPERSVIPWLRQLGCRLDDAREAAKLCEHMPDAPLEERLRVALRYSQRRTIAPDVGTAA